MQSTIKRLAHTNTRTCVSRHLRCTVPSGYLSKVLLQLELNCKSPSTAVTFVLVDLFPILFRILCLMLTRVDYHYSTCHLNASPQLFWRTATVFGVENVFSLIYDKNQTKLKFNIKYCLGL